MPEKIDQAFDALSDQSKKFDLALFYTRGDQDKARDMVSGIFKDLYVIKVVFSTSSNFGAFMMFFNITYCMLIGSYIIISSSYEVEELKTTVGWKEFEAGIEKLLKKGKTDYDLGRRVRDALNQSFSLQLSAGQRSADLKRLIETNDHIAVIRLITNFFQDKTGYQIASMEVVYESISSIDMELFSISSKKVSPDDIKRFKNELKAREESKIKVEPDEDSELSGKDVKLLLAGEIILSPIKGKALVNVAVGDRIKVNLDAYNPRAVSVARAFKCYNEEEGRMLPIPAYVVSKERLPDGGYKISALIEKGIYVKIVEQEENIKIAMDYSEALDDQNEIENVPHRSLQMIMIYIIAILIIIGLAIIFFM